MRSSGVYFLELKAFHLRGNRTASPIGANQEEVSSWSKDADA